VTAVLMAAGAVLRRYVRWREALIAGMQLLHFHHWAMFQAPLLTQFLSAAKLSNPLWMARVTSIEARSHQTPPSSGGCCDRLRICKRCCMARRGLDGHFRLPHPLL